MLQQGMPAVEITDTPSITLNWLDLDGHGGNREQVLSVSKKPVGQELDNEKLHRCI